MLNKSTMFTARQPTWSGLGTKVETARTSAEALKQSKLDWSVIQQPIYTEQGHLIPNYKANVRDSDNSVLGIVTDRYSVVQNTEAFSFIDVLLGEGVRFENIGSLQNGRRCFILAKLPDRYVINGERIDPYLCFCNSHDGSLALTIFMTPIRIFA
jgi:phage/plasmid-like protein (TIGR03299 family)